MRVVLLLLATRAAIAWSPSLQKQPQLNHPRLLREDSDNYYPPSSLAWEQSFPQTLGDIENEETPLRRDGSPPFALLRMPLINNHPLPKSQPSETVVLHNSDSRSRNPKPAPRISHTDAGTLQMEFPATGLDSNAIITGAFGVAWFSALVPATTTLAAVPFLLPFYLAGGLVAKSALVEPFTTTELSIGVYGWSLCTSRYGKTKEVASGATPDLQRAVVIERARETTTTATGSNQDGRRRVIQQYPRYELRLVFAAGNNNQRSLAIGSTFDNLEEPAQLAQTINQQLDKLRSETEEGATSDNFFFPL